MNTILNKENHGFKDMPSHIKNPLSYNRDLPKLNVDTLITAEINNSTQAMVTAFNNDSSYKHDMLDMKGTSSDEAIIEAENQYNGGVMIKSIQDTNHKTPIYIGYKLDKNNKALIDNNVIVGSKNSKLTIILDYTNEQNIIGYANSVTKILANEGSHLKIIKIQRLGKSVVRHENVLSNLLENSKLEFINIELGSDFGIYKHQSNLIGSHSESIMKTIYLGDEDNKLTFEYTMNQFGKETHSEIDCKGALLNKAKKSFTGTLDFKQGSVGSKGTEIEYVMLLNDSVKSISVPILLCAEDDVEGEHAASAGQIKEDKLMYLMSRGLSETEAKMLIIEGYFNPILDYISDNDLKAAVNDSIKERMSHA